jgi:hypothetical protein
MKKIVIIISLFLAIVLILFSTTNFKQSVVVKQNNISKKPLKIKLNHYTDRYCNMTIKSLSYSAQAVLENGNTLFFDDPSCLVLWLNKQKDKDKKVLWVYAKDKNIYIDAKNSWYHFGEDTPMEYGFGAYKQKKDGYIDFEEFELRVLRGETMQNLNIRKEILGKH